MLTQRSLVYPYRTTRSSSLPLKIIGQNKSPVVSDKMIHSWNGDLTCTRLCMYANLSVSDFCINLIGNDLPISNVKEVLLTQRKAELATKLYNSSDESNSGSSESISMQASSESEAEPEPETQFAFEQDNKESNIDLTLTGETSSGYLSSAPLDDTCTNLRAGSSSDEEDELFKDFGPRKSCLKKLFIDCSGIEVNATSSPLNPSTPTSPSFSLCSSSTISSPNSCTSFNSSSANKKRVSFADSNGRELCTIRTMSEPSNCPPKLTSKIVEYFLNREFNSTSTRLNDYYYSNYTSYGISASSSSSNDASIAVYSLNFAQPAGDYLKFRQRLDEKNVCLENVVLNRFCINGTIKVKNINFHKQVFIRCSLDKWSSYQDIQAQYVPSEYYSTPVGPSSPTSYSATFYEATYQPGHKDYDTFRFQFDLPKHVDAPTSNNSAPNNIIQFCVCYQTGNEQYWDNNYGINYEILQYVIGLVNKPAQAKSNFYVGKAKPNNYIRFDSAPAGHKSPAPSISNQSTSSIYY